MARPFGALSVEEERHALLARAHLALAAKCRLNSVEETNAAVIEAYRILWKHHGELYGQFQFLSPEILADKATMLVLLSVDGRPLERCSPEFRADPEMILAACRETCYMFELASPEMRADRDFVLQLVKVNGLCLGYASEVLRGDREVVEAAIQSEPLSLQDASDDLQSDRDLVLLALKNQTRRGILEFQVGFPINVLGDELFAGDVCDRELIIEAARVDGKVLAKASQALRRDEDFVLEVMRRAPLEDRELCYNQADELVQKTRSLEDFLVACDSVLAAGGEEAPVLTVRVSLSTASAASAAGNPDPATSCCCCEVSLLSGASFQCSFVEDDLNGQLPPSTLTVGHLAKRLQEELVKRTEGKDPATRVFVIFAKSNPKDDGDDEPTPVTPWDCNRPVTAFC